MLRYMYDVSVLSVVGPAVKDHHFAGLEISVRMRALTVFPRAAANFFHPPTRLL